MLYHNYKSKIYINFFNTIVIVDELQDCEYSVAHSFGRDRENRQSPTAGRGHVHATSVRTYESAQSHKTAKHEKGETLFRFSHFSSVYKFLIC